MNFAINPYVAELYWFYWTVVLVSTLLLTEIDWISHLLMFQIIFSLSSVEHIHTQHRRSFVTRLVTRMACNTAVFIIHLVDYYGPNHNQYIKGHDSYNARALILGHQVLLLVFDLYLSVAFNSTFSYSSV